MEIRTKGTKSETKPVRKGLTSKDIQKKVMGNKETKGTAKP